MKMHAFKNLSLCAAGALGISILAGGCAENSVAPEVAAPALESTSSRDGVLASVTLEDGKTWEFHQIAGGPIVVLGASAMGSHSPDASLGHDPVSIYESLSGRTAPQELVAAQRALDSREAPVDVPVPPVAEQFAVDKREPGPPVSIQGLENGAEFEEEVCEYYDINPDVCLTPHSGNIPRNGDGLANHWKVRRLAVRVFDLAGGGGAQPTLRIQQWKDTRANFWDPPRWRWVTVRGPLTCRVEELQTALIFNGFFASDWLRVKITNAGADFYHLAIDLN